ncbi:hypothetical protein LEMA_P077160.1 [Plenodomus lingam JN3]|uniref:Ubiquitin 3 binding protein But2 C-terminal domain-containing protein n=1 Tax=Leptosphaeria maculans (strain JN3 / isolate v23.1.3 / race Av1-4-5-6-7-8) TaxID=985895 RepID=E5A932_LEPMJ|nr:hypothetical protein LEMA_P077160.1 [Plenodomus lingam JN3]CBY00127.1 hypothetical protein LEMA_P077160.1 [Plenodomus lingam JN3]
MFFSKDKSNTSAFAAMFSSQEQSGSSKYTPVILHDHEDSASSEKSSSSQSEPYKDDHTSPLLEASNNHPDCASAKSSRLPKVVLYLSFALALLSTVNVAILPATLSNYHFYPFSDSELEKLPHGDPRLGLERAAKVLTPPAYYHAWPDRIARVSRKLKNAVWGQGVQVYISVEDSTIMRFPIPSTGVNACALIWQPPPELSGRAKDVTTKGDVTQIEVWQLLAPSATSSSSIEELDYDSLAYSTIPVRGELLGVLDITAKPNSTTVEFACPSEAKTLTVELRCQRVACHVSFMQLDMAPRVGFKLMRRRE